MAEVRTSIHGRAFGLDENGALLVRQNRTGTKLAGTSDSTGTKLHNNGFVSVVTTTNDTWTLGEAQKGNLVTLFTGSSSTGIHSINLGNSLCYSTAGIAGSTVTLIGMGASVSLYGLTSALWQLVARAGSTASADVSS
jgi:hypothetical protein